MDTTKLVAVITLIIALSIASERLVEIAKGLLSKWLDGKSDLAWKEGVRRAALQVLAVVAGVVTAYLARPAIPPDVLPATDDRTIMALGLLASGGSGFWNSVLTYVLQVKDLKGAEARAARAAQGLPVPKN